MPPPRRGGHFGTKARTESKRVASARIEHVSVEHQESDVHVLVDYRPPLGIPGGIGGLFGKVLRSTFIADKRIIHSFDLSKHELLGWTSVVP